MATARRGLALVAALSLCGQSAGAAEDPKVRAASLARAWSAVRPPELEGLWEAAQASGSVIAIEPESQVVGSPAARKKTWAAADFLLKSFVYGFQPNWFPADVVRRTACGGDPRWGYFWHGLSGDERDLHPWVDGLEGFEHLVGARKGVLVGGRALDLSPCSEVYGEEAGSRRCLYGEVTPPAGFETWFCGGRGRACRDNVSASPKRAPPDLADPEVACFYGPWVLERVHDWRPEIHPAEVLWVRKTSDRGYWTFALVPDDSGRFRKGKHFEKGVKPAGWKPWSTDRPVELWVAFSSTAGEPLAFDLSVKRFDKKPRPAEQVVLRPPDPAPDFAVLPHRLSSLVTVAARTWPAGPGGVRGFLVLRARTANEDRRALVLRLRGRDLSAPEWPAELPGFEREEAALAVPPSRPPSVRLLGVARVRPGPGGRFTVTTLVRFDPARPAEPGDEEAADRLNEGLRGKARGRVAAFGNARPFRVEWDVAPREVRVVAFRGPATSAVVVTHREERAELSIRERFTSLGSIDVTVPPGGVVTGEGRIVYEGQDVGLRQAEARVVFRAPVPAYANEWELLSGVLKEIDQAAAEGRLQALRRGACAPAEPAECETAPVAASVAQALADPGRRWAALRELSREDRPFARFVRLFSKALLWDGEVEEAELEKLKSLLSADGGRAVKPWIPRYAAVVALGTAGGAVTGLARLPSGLAFVATARQQPVPAPTPTPDPTAFSVYALSRGKGVPPQAREALRKVEEVAEADRRRGVKVESRRTRIGIEGETRLCLDYAREDDARRALDRVEKIVKGVDLVNLVRGACGEPEKMPDKKEDQP